MFLFQMQIIKQIISYEPQKTLPQVTIVFKTFYLI